MQNASPKPHSPLSKILKWLGWGDYALFGAVVIFALIPVIIGILSLSDWVVSEWLLKNMPFLRSVSYTHLTLPTKRIV